MAEVVSEYEPLDPWWTLEQLSLGDWLAVPNFKAYIESDAAVEATKQARVQNTSYRIVSHLDSETTEVGAQYDPPTTWWTAEKEDSPGSDTWTALQNPDIAGSTKFYSLGDAQAVAQNAARNDQARTRVSSV
jgi:hypothetical protein